MGTARIEADRSERRCTVKELRFKEFLAREYDLPPEEVEELLDDARSTLGPLLREVREYARKGDLKDLSRKAHQLKGILGYLGLEDLQEQARTLEKLAGTGQDSSVLFLENKLLPALADFLEQLGVS